jgi:hypothetical protein
VPRGVRVRVPPKVQYSQVEELVDSLRIKSLVTGSSPVLAIISLGSSVGRATDL